MKNVKVVDTPKSKRDQKKNPTPLRLKEDLEALRRIEALGKKSIKEPGR